MLSVLIGSITNGVAAAVVVVVCGHAFGKVTTAACLAPRFGLVTRAVRERSLGIEGFCVFTLFVRLALTFIQILSNSFTCRRHVQSGFMPSAAEGLYQLDAGNESLAGQLGLCTLSTKRSAVGVHHVQKANNARTITLRGQFGGLLRRTHSAILGSRLPGEELNAGQAVFHIAKGYQHALTIFRHCFFISCPRAVQIRASTGRASTMQRCFLGD